MPEGFKHPLPTSSAISTASEGAKVLSVWLRDAAGNVSTRVDANGVVYRTLSTTYSLANDYSDDIVLTANQNRSGTVYYALYNANQGTLTASQVKTAATGATGGALVSNGTLAIGAASTNYTADFSGVPDKTLYTLYAVAEDAHGLDLDANVKKYGGVAPTLVSQQTYPTAIAGKGGITMRYVLHMPVGYYDSTNEWPLLVYIHGNGETSSSATADESFFTTGPSNMYKTPFASRATVPGQDDIPMIQVALQCNSTRFNCTNGTDSNLHKEMIDQVIALHRVNTKRIYMTGASYGGQGTWRFIVNYPGVVAAAVPTMANPPSAYNATTLCNAFGGNHDTSVWAYLHQNDGVYTDETILTTAISNVQSCATFDGDARVTISTENAAYPFNVTANRHTGVENIFFTPHWSYGNDRFEYWNGSASVADTIPPTRLVPADPGMQADLATASTQLGTSLNRIVDWLSLWSKP